MYVVANSEESTNRAKQLRDNPGERKAKRKFSAPSIPLLGPEVTFMPHQAQTLSTLYDPDRDKATFGCDAYGLDVAMGGGKTIMMLSDALIALESGRVRRPLLVMPENTIKQQKQEILRFTRRPMMNTKGEVVTTGSGKEKKTVFRYPVNVVVLSASTSNPRAAKRTSSSEPGKWNEDDLIKLVSKAPPNTIFIASYSWLSGAGMITTRGSGGTKGTKSLIMDSNLPEDQTCPSQFQIKYAGSPLLPKEDAKKAFPGFPFNDFQALWALAKEHPGMSQWFAHETAGQDYPQRGLGKEAGFDAVVSAAKSTINTKSKKLSVDPAAFFTGADFESGDSFAQKYPSFSTPPVFPALSSRDNAEKVLGQKTLAVLGGAFGSSINLGLFDLCSLAYYPKLQRLNPWQVVPRRCDRLLESGIDYVALDESHTIKNAGSKVSTVINAFSDKRVKVRRAASGTMMNNKPEDLIEQLNWMLPLVDETTGEVVGNAIFGSTDKFFTDYCEEVNGVKDWKKSVTRNVWDQKENDGAGGWRTVTDHALKVVKAVLNNATDAVAGTGNVVETEMFDSATGYMRRDAKVTQVGPFLTSLRRTNWMHLLPPKTETIHSAPFTPLQQNAYDAMASFVEKHQALNAAVAETLYGPSGENTYEGLGFAELNAAMGRKGTTGLSVMGGVGGDMLAFSTAMSAFCDNPDPLSKAESIKKYIEELKWLSECIDKGKYSDPDAEEEDSEPEDDGAGGTSVFVTDDDDETDAKAKGGRTTNRKEATEDLIKIVKNSRGAKDQLTAVLDKAIEEFKKIHLELTSLAARMEKGPRAKNGQAKEFVTTKVEVVDRLIKANLAKKATGAEAKLLAEDAKRKGLTTIPSPPRKVLVMVEDKLSAKALFENSEYKNQGAYYSASEVAELERFKSDPDVKVLFAVAQSLRVGHNLQMVNCMIVCKCPYAPGDLGQQLARAFRIGQKQPVDVHIVLATTSGFPGFDASEAAISAFEANRRAAKKSAGESAMSAPYDCYRFSQLVDKKSDISLVDSDIGVSDFPHPDYSHISQSDFLRCNEGSMVLPRVGQYLALDDYESREAAKYAVELGEELYYLTDDERQSVLEEAVMPFLTPTMAAKTKKGVSAEAAKAAREADDEKPILERDRDTFSGFDWDDPNSPATDILSLDENGMKALGLAPDGTPLSLVGKWESKADIKERLAYESRLRACDVPSGVGGGMFSKPFSYILQEEDIDLIIDSAKLPYRQFGAEHPMNVLPMDDLKGSRTKEEDLPALKAALKKLVGRKIVGGFGLMPSDKANTLGAGFMSKLPYSSAKKLDIEGSDTSLIVVGQLRETLDRQKVLCVGLIVADGLPRDESSGYAPRNVRAGVKVTVPYNDETRLDYPAMDALPIGTAVKPKDAWFKWMKTQVRQGDSTSTVDFAKALAALAGRGSSNYVITTIDSAVFDDRRRLVDPDDMTKGSMVVKVPIIQYRVSSQFRFDVSAMSSDPRMEAAFSIVEKVLNGNIIVPGLISKVVKDSSGKAIAVSGSFQYRIGQDQFDVIPGMFGAFDPVQRSKARTEAAKAEALAAAGRGDEENMAAAAAVTSFKQMSNRGFLGSRKDVPTGNPYADRVNYRGPLAEAVSDYFSDQLGDESVKIYSAPKEVAEQRIAVLAGLPVDRLASVLSNHYRELCLRFPSFSTEGAAERGTSVIAPSLAGADSVPFTYNWDSTVTVSDLALGILMGTLDEETIAKVILSGITFNENGLFPVEESRYGGYYTVDYLSTSALRNLLVSAVEAVAEDGGFGYDGGELIGALNKLKTSSPDDSYSTLKADDSEAVSLLLGKVNNLRIRRLISKVEGVGTADLDGIKALAAESTDSGRVDPLKGRVLAEGTAQMTDSPSYDKQPQFLKGASISAVSNMLKSKDTDLDLSKLNSEDSPRLGVQSVAHLFSAVDAGYAVAFTQKFGKQVIRGAYVIFGGRLLQVGSSILSGAEVWRVTREGDKAKLLHLGFYDDLDAHDLKAICVKTSGGQTAVDMTVSHPLEKAGRNPVGGKTASKVIPSARSDWHMLIDLQ